MRSNSCWLWLLLMCLLVIVTSIETNMYFDKSIPDTETVLDESDFIAASRLAHDYNIDSYVNDSSMYRPGRFEGDIVNVGLDSKTIRSFMGEPNVRDTIDGVMRNAVRQTYLMWSDGRIPYTISSQYSSFSRSKIAEAIDEYRKRTCIDFAPKSAADQDYIHILPDDGCYSLVGRTGGKQPVSLGDGCIQKGIIIHELMHAVGFFHEQSRADRDDYVDIIWSNVESGLEDQFDKYSLNMITHLGTPYDYASVMHYSSTAFSKNGRATIEPKKKGTEIGQRIGFSENDLFKINKLYSCPQQGGSTEEGDSESHKISTKSGLSSTTLRPDETGAIAPGTKTPSILSTTISPDNETDDKYIACDDRRRDCEFLARSGHCQSKFSTKFMEENCARSCKVCKLKCDDTRQWCARWATTGMCVQTAFKDYMRSRCAKSCDSCQR